MFQTCFRSGYCKMMNWNILPIFCKERVIWKYNYGEASYAPTNWRSKNWSLNLNILSMNTEKIDLYSPIEQVSGRVKSVSSIPGEMQLQAYPHGADGRGSGGYSRNPHYLPVWRRYWDSCHVDSEQVRHDHKSEKNYLKHVKQSGYRSLHLIIYYTVETLNLPQEAAGRDPDRTGHGFLGHYDAFPSV